MNKNMTFTVDEHLLQEARKIAINENKTLSRMIREFLEQLVATKGKREKAIHRLMAHMKRGAIKVGKVKWSREELHER
jgi:predicted transcriptional regulator